MSCDWWRPGHVTSVLIADWSPPLVSLDTEVAEVEDGVDPVRLRCEAEGNPAPDIVWRKLGQTSIFR